MAFDEDSIGAFFKMAEQMGQRLRHIDDSLQEIVQSIDRIAEAILKFPVKEE